MNWLDIVIVCLAGIGVMKGLFDGFIKQVVSLIALVVGIILCSRVALWLSGILTTLDWFPVASVSIISYILAFVLIVAVIIAAGDLVHRVVGATPLSIFNHLVGAAFGIAVMMLFVSLCFNLMERIDTGSHWISMDTKLNSRMYYPVKEIIPTIFPSGLFSIEGIKGLVIQ